MSKILIVDDEEGIRDLIDGILGDEGYETLTAHNSDRCFETLESETVSLIILDIWLQGSTMDGLEILEKAKQDYPFIPIIMISGHGTIETAVSAIKQGAYDFIEKPFKADRLLVMVKRAIEAAALERENANFKPLSLDIFIQAGLIDEENALSMRRLANSDTHIKIDCNDPGKAKLLEILLRIEAGTNHDRIIAHEDFEASGEITTLTDPFQPQTSASLDEDFLLLGLREAREAFERHYLTAQIERFEGNISKTANFVGMERSALHRKLKSLNEAEVIDFEPKKAQSSTAK